jgi:hypothetical protein
MGTGSELASKTRQLQSEIGACTHFFTTSHESHLCRGPTVAACKRLKMRLESEKMLQISFPWTIPRPGGGLYFDSR